MAMEVMVVDTDEGGRVYRVDLGTLKSWLDAYEGAVMLKDLPADTPGLDAMIAERGEAAWVQVLTEEKRAQFTAMGKSFAPLVADEGAADA